MWHNIYYDRYGNQLSMTDPDGNQSHKQYSGRNGIKVTDYTYDLLGRLTAEAEQNGSTTQYSYDSRGNRTQMVSTTADGKATTISYTYDLRDRLLTEDKQSSEGSEYTQYSYDYNGNRIYRQWEEYSPANPEVIGTVGWQPAKLRHGVATSECREYNGYNQVTALTRDGKTTTYSYRPDGLSCSENIAILLCPYLQPMCMQRGASTKLELINLPAKKALHLSAVCGNIVRQYARL